MRQSAYLLSALLFSPFVSRLILIHDTGSVFGWLDLRGFLSDLGMALLAVPLLMLANRISRWLGVVLVVCWSFLHWANFENVLELDALASVFDLKFFSSGTFVLGSATALSRPILVVTSFAICALLTWRAGGLWAMRQALVFLLSGVALLTAQALWQPSNEAADWRQVNLFQSNLTYLIRGSAHKGTPTADARAAMLELVPEMAADLDGEPILPLPGEAKNVLLVMVEGLSGIFAPSLAAEHGLSDLFVMPNLDRIARENLGYSTFVAQNRKTNRGVFATLCGEPPNLVPGSPKMTQMAMAGGKVCLPQVLSNAGFKTIYMQAAPLAFMMKDQFAVNAGFDRVYGYTHFDQPGAKARNRWGIDDRTFLERGLKVIEELALGEEPWFASMLTVGTHHPYVIPEELIPSDANSDARRRFAYTYADAALGWFVSELDKRGLSEDTLILITSDESRGHMSADGSEGEGLDGIARRLTQNWGVLVALQPEELNEVVKEPFAQMDLALSILDYLGLGDRAGHFLGRSVFRSYENNRFLPFANTNRRRVYAFDTEGKILECRIDNETCSKWKTEGGFYFGNSSSQIPWDESTDSKLMEFAFSTQRDSAAATGDYEIELLGEPSQHVARKRILHGGPYVSLMPGQWLEVEIDVEAHGEGGSVQFVHWVLQSADWGFEQRKGQNERMFHERFELRSGDRLRLIYSIVPAEGGRMDGLRVESDASVPNSSPFDLVFHKSVMRVHTGGDHPGPGLVVQVQEVER